MDIDRTQRVPFSPATYAQRQRAIFEALGDAVMVLPASLPKRRSRDTDHPYRPDSELVWATGLEEPDVVAVFRGHADEERFVVFVRERDPQAEMWSGPRLGLNRAREVCGADAVFGISELEERLPGLITGADAIYYRLDESALASEQVRDALREARARGPRSGTGPRALVDPGEILDELRLRKDVQEIERMREAARITVAAFAEVAPLVRSGAGEWEIQGRLDGAFRALGGDGPAYESIVGSGPNACTLHYVRNDRRLEAGETVLIDAGASLGWYAADLTRSLPVDGVFTDAGRAVYEVVDRAREAAIAVVRPGANVSDVHHAAVQVLVDGLRALGVRQVGDAPLPGGSPAPWFPHQTSHWLGLDVHDVGDYARDGASRVLEPGMVLTVEPGLYFSRAFRDAGWGVPEHLWDIGVRVEDDIVVTPDGYENLTEAFPTDPDEVAAMVRGQGASE